MQIPSRTTIQAKTTSTVPVNGPAVTVDNSVINVGDWWTLALKIYSLTANGQVRFLLSFSTDGFNEDIRPGPSFSFSGGITPSADLRVSAMQKDYPDVPFGQGGVQARLAITNINAGASVTYESWVEH